MFPRVELTPQLAGRALSRYFTAVHTQERRSNMFDALKAVGRIVSLAALLLTIAGQAQCREPFQLISGVRFVLGMEQHYLWPWGDMLVPAGGRPGSGTLVSWDELQVAPTEGAGAFLDIKFGESHFLNLHHLAFSPTGFTTLKRPFRFQNRTYEEESVLETAMDFSWTRLGYGYALVQSGGWRLSPWISVHHVRNQITINGETKEKGIESNTRGLDGTYPVIGLNTSFLFPYGMEMGLHVEGMHLFTRGFLTYTDFRFTWAIHTDMVLSLGVQHRMVQYVEDNQPLNNQWFLNAAGVYGGFGVAF